MKTLSTFITFVSVVAILVGIIYFSYNGLVYLAHIYGTLEAAMRTTLLSILAVLIICSLMIGNAIKNSASGTRSLVMVDSKLHLYCALVEMYKPIVTENIDNRDASQQLLAKLDSIETELQVVAAGPVIAMHKNLRRALVEQNSKQSLTASYQQLIKVIRRDLGHNESQFASKIDVSTLQTPSSSLQNKEEKPA